MVLLLRDALRTLRSVRRVPQTFPFFNHLVYKRILAGSLTSVVCGLLALRCATVVLLLKLSHAEIETNQAKLLMGQSLMLAT